MVVNTRDLETSRAQQAFQRDAAVLSYLGGQVRFFYINDLGLLLVSFCHHRARTLFTRRRTDPKYPHHSDDRGRRYPLEVKMTSNIPVSFNEIFRR